MTDIKKLALGCNGMNMSNLKRSVETVHYALDRGITLLNTGEFYGSGESEMVLREALKGVPRDKYFLSVKFGALPLPRSGMYGLDMNPFHIKAHLAYSMHRLGVDYIDLYQPSRMDAAVPIEEVIGVLQDCIKEGYIGSIGLTQVSPEDIEKAVTLQPIKMLEVEYALTNRTIETDGVLEKAREHNIGLLAFGVLSHGLLAAKPAAVGANEKVTGYRPQIAPETKAAMLGVITDMAQEKHTSVEKLAQAYVHAKYPDMTILIGTTRKEHLQDSIDALSLTLSAKDIQRLEAAFPAGKFQEVNLPDIFFRNGKMIRR